MHVTKAAWRKPPLLWQEKAQNLRPHEPEEPREPVPEAEEPEPPALTPPWPFCALASSCARSIVDQATAVFLPLLISPRLAALPAENRG